MKKRNHNPDCLMCGNPTKTLSNHTTNDRGHVIVKRYFTRCNSPFCNDSYMYHGEGKTIREARNDYGQKYDKDFNEI